MRLNLQKEGAFLILFVCTGNTCRSPLAAALARAHGVDAQSAGLDADRGDPATIEAQFAAERYGADLSSHEARNVHLRLIREASQVYAMTGWHAQQLIRRYPEYAERIRVLAPPIPDPYGRGADAYEECARALLAAMRNAGIL
jgi:protein-tyrosine phosphatase